MKENLTKASKKSWIDRIKAKRNTIWSDIKPIYSHDDVFKYENFPTMRDLQKLGTGWEEFIQDMIANALEEYFDFLGLQIKDSQKKTFVELIERYYDRFNILDLKYFITQCKHNIYKSQSDRFINCPLVLEWFNTYINDKIYARIEWNREQEKFNEEKKLLEEYSNRNEQEIEKARESAIRAMDSIRLGECSIDAKKESEIKKKVAKIRLEVIKRNENFIGDKDYEVKVKTQIAAALRDAGINESYGI